MPRHTSLRERHRARPRLAAGVLVALLVGVAAPAANADTRTEVEEASRRLSALESQVTGQERQVDALTERLKDMSAVVDQRRAEAGDVQRQLRATRAELERTEAEHAVLRQQLGLRARSVYVRGPASMLSLVLEARSMSDLTDRVVWAGRLIRNDADLSMKVRRLAAELQEQTAHQTRLLAERAELVRQARREQRSLEDTFLQQQRRLADLARDRAELGRLVEQLRDKLRAEQLSSAIRTAGRGTPMTFAQWGEAFLRALGAPAARSNMVVMIAWQTAEYTQASWNPLATTYGMPGATVFNSHGVRNYTSLEQGIEATIKTLHGQNHGYEAIVANLRAGSDSMTTARAINASNWCRGCTNGNYVTGLIPVVDANYDRYAAA